MAAQSNVNLRNLVDAATQWHRIFASDRTRANLSPKFVDELEVFVGECRMIRWGMITTEDKIAEIWQGIMPGSLGTDEGAMPEEPAAVNENIVDYVLNGTAYVNMMTDIQSGHLETFLSDLTYALCWPYRAWHIDSELKERAAKPEFLKQAFTDTPWLLFVYVIGISPLEFSEDPLVFGPTSSTGDKDT